MSPAAPPSPGGIVLALGGGARGVAHLGVLEVLERERIPVAGLAGTSMGGLLGALWAAGVFCSRAPALPSSMPARCGS